MSTDRDDDALSWGDDDPTLDAGPTLPPGYVAVGKGSETITPASGSSPDAGTSPAANAASDAASIESTVASRERGHTETDAEHAAPVSNAALVILGVFGGVYALESVGWIIGGLRLQQYAEFLVAPLAYQVSLWLAVLTPLIWFVTVLFLTRGGRSWVRILLLAAGALLVLPWPFIMVGAIGQ